MPAESAHDAVLEFCYDDEATARIVEHSVRQEIDEIAGDRARATIDRDETEVVITVAAADLVALRAGCNTWLTLVTVAQQCVRGASLAGD